MGRGKSDTPAASTSATESRQTPLLKAESEAESGAGAGSVTGLGHRNRNRNQSPATGLGYRSRCPTSESPISTPPSGKYSFQRRETVLAVSGSQNNSAG